jgi:hypothetical protein
MIDTTVYWFPYVQSLNTDHFLLQLSDGCSTGRDRYRDSGLVSF